MLQANGLLIWPTTHKALLVPLLLNLEYISHLFLVRLLLTLNREWFVLNGWYIQLRGTQKNDFWPRARSFNFLCFFSLSIMKIIHWATSKCVKYARIRVFPDSCFPYKDRIHISVLLRENANQRKPLFWWILPLLSFLLEVHGRDNQMALKGLLKFKFYL